GPGRAVRAFAESDLAGMPAQAPAQITAADLTDAALVLACWGTPRGEGLALLTPPPRAEIEAAEATLRSLGLVDDQGRPTPSGTRVAQLPVGARARGAAAARGRAGGAAAARGGGGAAPGGRGRRGGGGGPGRAGGGGRRGRPRRPPPPRRGPAPAAGGAPVGGARRPPPGAV